MTVKIVNALDSDEVLEKAALWDAWHVLQKDECRWLVPFFWAREGDSPSGLGYGLALCCKLLGADAVYRTLVSDSFLLVAEATRDSQERGGHPVEEKTLLVLWRLARGAEYELVLQDEKDDELLECRRRGGVSAEDRRRAAARAKRRLRWAKNRLMETGANVKRLSPPKAALIRSFRAGLRKLDRELP